MPLTVLHRSGLQLRKALALSLCALLAESLAAQTGPSTPYELRALYLYNFAKYTEWPQEAFADSAAPFVLGILGEDPFGKDLDIIKGKSIKNRKLVVKYFSTAREARDCHILFISPSEKDRVPQTLQTLKQLSVLTVSEFEGFMDQDGMVNLAEEKKRLVFEINQAAAEKVGLKLDARLLQLAKAVRK